MNNYQKAGTFAARIVGVAMVLWGVWMLLNVVAFLSTVSLPGQSFVLWCYPLFLIVVGVACFTKASRIGEFLGAGLD